MVETVETDFKASFVEFIMRMIVFLLQIVEIQIKMRSFIVIRLYGILKKN